MLLNRANVAIVALASTDDERLNLRGLRVEIDGTTVATNGHVLGYVSPAPENIPAIVEPATAWGLLPTSAVKEIAKAMPTKFVPEDGIHALAVVEAIRDADAATGDEGGFSIATSPDGRSITRVSGPTNPQAEFPETWRAAVPRRRPLAAVCVNARYLEAVARVAVKCGLESVFVEVCEPHQPLTVRGTLFTGQEVTLVAMPLRSDPDTAARPGPNTKYDDDPEVEPELPL